MKNPTLDDICEFIVDCLHATAPIQEDGYPLIRTPNIGKGRLILDGVHRVSEETYEKWTRRAVPKEHDLILAREAPAGNVAVIQDGQQVCLGQRTVHLRPNPKLVNSSYLCYFLLAPRQQGLLLAGETGVAAKHVNMKDIRRLPLENLPGLKSQSKIADILSSYDDLIQNNQRRIQLLEQSARLLYKEWFVHFRFPGHEHVKIVDGVPEGWDQNTLGEIAPLSYGKALKKDNRLPGDIPVYGSSGVVGTHNQPLVEGRGIIVGRKGNVGSVYWCENSFHPIDTVYYISTPTANLYLYYALNQMTFVNTDVAVPGLNRDYAHSRMILLPTETILDAFHDLVEPVHKQIHNLKAFVNATQKARDLLLPRLMNGEIAV